MKCTANNMLITQHYDRSSVHAVTCTTHAAKNLSSYAHKITADMT